MTLDFQKILKSKREFRRGLAALPIEEKLRLLDGLRERLLAIHGTSSAVYPPIPADGASSETLRSNPNPMPPNLRKSAFICG